MNQDTHTDRHKWSKIKKRVRFSPELKIFFFRQLEKTKLFSDLWPHHIFDNAPFAPCFWWSKLFPCTIILCSVTSALFQVASKHADVVKKLCCCVPAGNLLTSAFGLSFTHTYCTRQHLLLCLLLVRNDIWFELQWVRVTHVVAASGFGLGSPPRVLTGANAR